MGASSAWSIKTSKPRDSNLTLMEFTSWREYSASRKLPSGEHLPGVVKMGSADRDEFARYVTDEAEVLKIRSALTALA